MESSAGITDKSVVLKHGTGCGGNSFMTGFISATGF